MLNSSYFSLQIALLTENYDKTLSQNAQKLWKNELERMPNMTDKLFGRMIAHIIRNNPYMPKINDLHIAYKAVYMEKPLKGADYNYEQQVQAMEEYFSEEKNVINFIDKYICIDSQNPTATNYEFRDIKSSKIIEYLYEIAVALSECPEKKKLREHFRKFVTNAKYKKPQTQEELKELINSIINSTNIKKPVVVDRNSFGQLLDDMKHIDAHKTCHGDK